MQKLAQHNTNINLSDAPDIQTIGSFELLCLQRYMPVNDQAAVLDIWNEYVESVVPHLKTLSGRHFSISKFDGSDHFQYTAASEITEFESFPTNLTRLLIDPIRCLKYTYQGNTEMIPEAINDIWTNRIPALGLNVDMSQLIQMYHMQTDQISDEIRVEIFVPLHD